MPPKASLRTGKLRPTSLRLAADLYARLEEAASTAGRSLTSEIERRLERSFEYDQAFGDAREILRQAKETTARSQAAELRRQMMDQGFHQVHNVDGHVAWAPLFDFSQKISLPKPIQEALNALVAEFAGALDGAAKPGVAESPLLPVPQDNEPKQS